MLYEQDNQTYFTVQDEMSALDVRLRIEASDAEGFADCIFIEPQLDPPVALSPADALDLLKWLEYHRARLEKAAEIAQARALIG